MTELFSVAITPSLPKKMNDVNMKIKHDKGNGEKYLFPNPVLFDDRTNISQLYEGDMTKIKPKNNRIEVLEPCEITEPGFIEFRGKFRLL